MQIKVGTVVVLRKGQVLAHIPAPTARDAQGTNVPVAMRISGEKLVLSIHHRRLDIAYPILVDPEVVRNITENSKRWVFTEKGRRSLPGEEAVEEFSPELSSKAPTSSSPLSIALSPRSFPAVSGYDEEVEGRWEWTPPPGLKEITSVEVFDAAASFTGPDPYPAESPDVSVEYDACDNLWPNASLHRPELPSTWRFINHPLQKKYCNENPIIIETPRANAG